MTRAAPPAAKARHDGNTPSRIAGYLALVLAACVASSAALGLIAATANNAFANWSLVESVINNLDKLAIAIGAGLLGLMTKTSPDR